MKKLKSICYLALAILNIFLIHYIFDVFVGDSTTILAIDPVTALVVMGLVKGAKAAYGGVQASKAASAQRRAQQAAKKATKQALQQAQINTQEMRDVDERLYNQQQELISQDLSTFLENTGADARTAAAATQNLQAGAAKSRMTVEQQRRADLRALEKDVADEEQNVAKRVQAIREGIAAGAQQAAVDAQAQKLAGQQMVLDNVTGIAGDVLGFAGGDMTQFAPTGYKWDAAAQTYKII